MIKGSFPGRIFDRVLVRSLPPDYEQCHSENPLKNEIDPILAKQQHLDYISILKECGIEVTVLPRLSRYPDSVFVQDPGLIGAEPPILCRFGLPSRRGEEEALLQDLSTLNLLKGRPRRIVSEGTLEGGDVLVTQNHLFVGTTGRSNHDGAGQLERYLGNIRLTRVRANAFHLLSGCSYLGSRTILLAPSIVNPEVFAGYRIIEVPDREAYASNTLYLGDGRVLMPSGYPRTCNKLKDAGFSPIELDNSEFWKGDGAITCLSSPAYNVPLS